MWAIIALIVIVIVGIVWYIQQQKKAEEEAAAATAAAAAAAAETTPSPSGLEVDTMKGLPKDWENKGYVAGTKSGETKYPRISFPNVAYTVPLGQAKKAEDCRAASERMGHNSWGWRKKDGSCFAYIDSNLIARMYKPDLIDQSTLVNFVVGCTQPGMKVLDGCEDWTNGDRVRGKGGASTFVELTPVQRGISLDDCIAKGKAQGKDAILYFTNNRGYQSDVGRCHEIVDTNNLVGYTGNPTDIGNIQACTDPSKKIINGCE